MAARIGAVLALGLFLGQTASAHGAATPDLVGIARAIDVQEELNAELATAVPRLAREALDDEEELDRQEADQTTVPTLDQLREARFEADARRTRLGATGVRIEGLRAQQRDLAARIAALDRTAADDTLESYAAGVELEMLRRLSQLVQDSIDRSLEAQKLQAQRLDTLLATVALLESRVRLADPGARRDPTPDPRVDALRDLVARMDREGVRLANAVGAMEPRTPAEQLQKRQTELEADHAALRSTVRADDVELLAIGRSLDSLADTAESYGQLPPRVVADGLAVAETAGERLRGIEDAIGAARQRLADQRALLPAPTSGTAAQVESLHALIDDVASVLDGQQEAVRGLEARRAAVAATFAHLADSAGDEQLLAREPLPSGGAAWARVARSALRLPQEIATAMVASVTDVVAKFRAAPETSRWLAGLAGAAVVCGLLLIRRLLRSRFAEGSDNTLAAPLAALGDSMVSLLPAAIWWAVASVLGFEREATLLIGSVLLIWPLVAVVLRFAGHVLFDGSADRKSLRVRRQFFRRLCWSTILGGLVAAILTLTATVELTPAMDNLIARGAMVCVLLIALPALQLRSLILAMAGPDAGFGLRVLAWLSLLVPTVLAGAAVIGLAGYLNLAWTIIGHFLWLVLIGVVLMLALGVVDDLRDAFARRVAERHPAVGPFWVENFVDPAHRLVQLGLTVMAGWLLVAVYGWDWETPGIRQAVALGQIPILTLGESSLRLTDLASAVVLVALAFWVGGWSRQVSYNLALTRVRDQGIRQSLSTFIQYVVIVSGLLLTLKVIGLDLTALTVFAASVGVGIGFGMQTVVNNFVSGILLLVERPLKVTDVVTIGGETGEVSRIGIRSLTVQMFDRKELIIPNSEVIGGTFTNWTRVDDVLREVLLFTVSYQDDPALAARLVEEIARGTTGVMAHPAPKATTYEFTERGITVRLQYYVHQRGSVGGLDIRSSILERTHAGFARAGFTVPAANGDVALAAGAAPAALAAPA